MNNVINKTYLKEQAEPRHVLIGMNEKVHDYRFDFLVMFCKRCSKTILQGLWKSMMRITPKSMAITAFSAISRLIFDLIQEYYNEVAGR